MRTFLRRVFPWPTGIAIALAYFVFAATFNALVDADEPQIFKFASLLMSVSAAALGVVRAVYFHPFFLGGYRNWLVSTPWTVEKQLPFGPIELDWVDGLPIATLMLGYAFFPGSVTARVIAVFLFFHCLMLAISIYPAANHVPAFATLFGLGLMAKLWPHAWPCAATGVVVYLIVYDGVRIWLRDHLRPTVEKTVDERPSECGWPYDRLLKDPVDAEERGLEFRRSPNNLSIHVHSLPSAKTFQAWADIIAWSLLIGWWAACLEGVMPDARRHQGFLTIAAVIGLFAALLIRGALYGVGYAQPISFWGRLWTGRWIIPGYDVVLLGLLIIPVAPALVLTAGVWWGLPWKLVGPIALSAMAFAALSSPPRLRRWRLVGTHRLVPTTNYASHE